MNQLKTKNRLFKFLRVFGSVLLIFIFLVGGYKLLLSNEKRVKIKYGEELIQKIEQYRSENNRIPESNDWEVLNKIGIPTKESDQPYYMKIDTDTYQFTYVEGFLEGPYLIYNSHKKSWEVKY